MPKNANADFLGEPNSNCPQLLLASVANSKISEESHNGGIAQYRSSNSGFQSQNLEDQLL